MDPRLRRTARRVPSWTVVSQAPWRRRRGHVEDLSRASYNNGHLLCRPTNLSQSSVPRLWVSTGEGMNPHVVGRTKSSICGCVRQSRLTCGLTNLLSSSVHDKTVSLMIIGGVLIVGPRLYSAFNLCVRTVKVWLFHKPDQTFSNYIRKKSMDRLIRNKTFKSVYAC